MSKMYYLLFNIHENILCKVTNKIYYTNLKLRV